MATLRGKHRVERHGTRAGKRAHQPVKTRSTSGRRGAALEEARKAQAKLDRRIAAEQRIAEEQAAAFERARILSEARDAEQRRVAAQHAATAAAARQEAQRAQKRALWSLGQARALILQGYSVERVMEVTGWDRFWVEDADRMFG